MVRFALGLLVAVALFAVASYAAGPNDPVKHEGKIVKVGKDSLVVEVEKKEMTVFVNKDTKITNDGKPAKLSDLQSDEKVTVLCKKDGQKMVAVEVHAKKA